MSLRSSARMPGLGDADELHLWAVGSGASVALVDARLYEPCRVVGIVQRLRVSPAARAIEVELFDGTGSMVVRWFGPPLPDLRTLPPGRALVVDGVPVLDGDGRIILNDPRQRPIPLPEAFSVS